MYSSRMMEDPSWETIEAWSEESDTPRQRRLVPALQGLMCRRRSEALPTGAFERYLSSDMDHNHEPIVYPGLSSYRYAAKEESSHHHSYASSRQSASRSSGRRTNKSRASSCQSHFDKADRKTVQSFGFVMDNEMTLFESELGMMSNPLFSCMGFESSQSSVRHRQRREDIAQSLREAQWPQLPSPNEPHSATARRNKTDTLPSVRSQENLEETSESDTVDSSSESGGCYTPFFFGPSNFLLKGEADDEREDIAISSIHVEMPHEHLRSSSLIDQADDEMAGASKRKWLKKIACVVPSVHGPSFRDSDVYQEGVLPDLSSMSQTSTGWMTYRSQSFSTALSTSLASSRQRNTAGIDTKSSSTRAESRLLPAQPSSLSEGASKKLVFRRLPGRRHRDQLDDDFGLMSLAPQE